MSPMRRVLAIPLVCLALVLSAGPLFLIFAMFIGTEIRLTMHPLVLLANIGLALLCWRASYRSFHSAQV